MLSSYELPTPLGAWKCASHREWEWRYAPVTKTLYRRNQSKFQAYKPDKNRPYNFIEDECVANLPSTEPVSVKVLRGGIVIIRFLGIKIGEEDFIPKSFWDMLDSWVGEWM